MLFPVMKEETALGMKLLGVNTVADLGPQHLELLDDRLLGRAIA